MTPAQRLASITDQMTAAWGAINEATMLGRWEDREAAEREWVRLSYEYEDLLEEVMTGRRAA